MFRSHKAATWVSLVIALAFVIGLALVWLTRGDDTTTVRVPPECQQSGIGDTVVVPAGKPLFFDC